MQNRNRAYLVLSVLLCLVIVGGYTLYSYVKSRIPFGITKSVSVALQLKEFSDEKLSDYNPKTQQSIDVLHYTIKINLDTQKKNIDGDVTIRIKINNKSVETIPLNLYDNMNVTLVEINGKKVGYGQDDMILSVKKTDKSFDTVNVRVVYNGTPKSLGFGSFNFETHQKHPFVYTLSEPVFASTWLPCVDLPNDKAQMDMFITNDSCCVSLSNGNLVETKTVGSKKTYHWKTVYPISTYLIAIYSGRYKSFSQKYQSVTKDSLALSYYAFESDMVNAKKDFGDHPQYIKTFEEIFGAYPFIKEKYSVAEILWQNGAMEHQTLTGIGSNFIGGHKFFTDMLIHELAHHWWGNAVGPKTWKDIWLNEGFATYSVALYWEKTAGPLVLQSTMNAKFGTFGSGTLYSPGDALFGNLVYNKGAWVLHMLRREIGDNYFFKTMKEYFRVYKYSNASTSDFEKLCEKISEKNLSQFFNQWVYKGVGIIELAYDWNADKTGTEISLVFNTEQLQNGYDIYKFPLEVKFLYEGNESETKFVTITQKQQRFYFTLKSKPKEVVLDPDKWLLATFESRND